MLLFCVSGNRAEESRRPTRPTRPIGGREDELRVQKQLEVRADRVLVQTEGAAKRRHGLRLVRCAKHREEPLPRRVGERPVSK